MIDVDVKDLIIQKKEGRTPGVITIDVPTSKFVGFLTPDGNVQNYRGHFVKLQYGKKDVDTSIICNLHVYEELDEKFNLTTHDGNIPVSKSQLKTKLYIAGDNDADLLEIWGLNFAPLNMKSFNRPTEIKQGQFRILGHYPNHQCCTTSCTDKITRYADFPGRLFIANNSEDGSCGSPILDCENHIVGIHGGRTNKFNYFYIIPWDEIENNHGLRDF